MKRSTEVRIVDAQTGGMKGQKAERYDLLPFEALDEIARVYHYGAQKYDDHNWRKGYRWSLSIGALLRHVARRMRGEIIDPESGLRHLAHAGFHILTLLTFDELRLGTNDLPADEAFAEAMRVEEQERIKLARRRKQKNARKRAARKERRR